MSKKKERKVVKAHRFHAGEAGAIAGELVGGVLGSAGGPPGVVAGMVLGAVAGTITGEVIEAEEKRAHVHDEELDEAIGVVGGDLGAAKPGAPRAVIGAPSAASCGVSRPSSAPAEGPMQDIDEDD